MPNLEYVDLPRATIPKLKLSQDMIDSIRSGSLDTDIHDTKLLYTIRNPPHTTLPKLDTHTGISIRIFKALSGGSEAMYNEVRHVLATNDPAIKLLSHHSVKKEIEKLSNVPLIRTDMCPRSCVAFTGPFAALRNCPQCNASRFRPNPNKPTKEIPVKQFYTVPLGPQIQGLFRSPQGAQRMHYRDRHSTELGAAIAANQGKIDNFDDILSGSDYWEAYKTGKFDKNDVFVLLSFDGAQLFRDKASDCWFAIWIILNLSPDLRYKKKYILPAAFVPGPEKPELLESFMIPTLRHLSAIQKEGLKVCDWKLDPEKNEWQSKLVKAKVNFFGLGADSVALPELDGRTGYSGYVACRVYDKFKSRHKPGIGIYYPAALKPTNYPPDETGNHGDVDIGNIGGPDRDEYMRNLVWLLESLTLSAYRDRQLLTGIVRPTLCLAFDSSNSCAVPNGFTLDLMHLSGINLPQFLISVWRGTIDKLDLSVNDGKKPDFFVLDNSQVWKEHGALVASVHSYLPSSFNRPPRNPAEKINSGYKAVEFMTYFWVLGPAVFRLVLPDNLWRHFCKLVRGIRIVNQRVISLNQIIEAHQMLVQWEREFEEMYYQRRIKWLQLVRPCVHAIVHAARETLRRGPLNISAQWALENTIGNLGREVHQFSNPFSNLGERGILRARMNVMYSMYSELNSPFVAPRDSIVLSNGYILLRARTEEPVFLAAEEANAFAKYFPQESSPIPVQKWARLQLPNGQIARSLWKEQYGVDPRIARNVKFHLGNQDHPYFGEVQFFAFTEVVGQKHALALVSVYSVPDAELLANSHNTLHVCRYAGHKKLRVIQVEAIESVVAMIPFPLKDEEKNSPAARRKYANCFYVGEKLVLEKKDDDFE
ncbi:hypothetical protein BDN72DRAFT_809271 [Pluteus cervinus]|uniref:Uncharacterized protein n=1 Tax=Pluteus cervinus TaxID=181527 RepID=A0ACD3BFI1_9AGAR|nr:hypothetical protein BDN72DRAFT_809271 [Pluteus cervinus]